MKIGRLTISDRASAGIYADRSGPEIENVLREFLGSGVQFEPLIVPDEVELISAALRRLADERKRDVTPEATRAVLEKELPGFGEIMRAQSFARVKTAVLSRAVAGTRGACLIVNLPGKPTAVRECLEILAPAIIEGLAHLRGENPHEQKQNGGRK